MAEYSGHVEAPQACGRPFEDHKDAAPAYEGKGGRQFNSLGSCLQVEALLLVPHEWD